MLDDYLKVRGVGDVLAAGSALVVITMVAHYWGYVVFAGVGMLSYFSLQDYMRLSITFIPIILVGVIVTYSFFYITGSEGDDGRIVESIKEYIYMILAMIPLIALVLGVVMILLVYDKSPIWSILVLLIGSISVMAYSNYVFRLINRFNIVTVISIGLVLWMIVSFGAGVFLGNDRLNTSTPSVAVHVNYNDEPIEGTILINLSNTLLLSEPGSTDYIAISQREIRSIQRLNND